MSASSLRHSVILILASIWRAWLAVIYNDHWMEVLSNVWHTHRGRGGSGQQGKDSSTGNDDVIRHLRDQVNSVVYKDYVLIAVDKVHDGFCWMTVRGKSKRKTKTEMKRFNTVDFCWLWLHQSRQHNVSDMNKKTKKQMATVRITVHST